MSKIKNMIAKETSTWVEFPDIDGFEVNLRFLTREDLVKIRGQSLQYKFNKRTRQREEEVDSDKFLEAYSEKAVADWRGLKVKHLPLLLPVDISFAGFALPPVSSPPWFRLPAVPPMSFLPATVLSAL